MTANEVEVYKIFSRHFSQEEADRVIMYLDDKAKSALEAQTKSLATKEDVANVRAEIEKSGRSVIQWVAIALVAQAGVITTLIKLL